MNGGCHFLWAFGWLLLFPGGFWMLCCGANGNVHAKSTKNDTQKNGFGPSNTTASWHTFGVPHFAIPNVGCFQFSPPPGVGRLVGLCLLGLGGGWDKALRCCRSPGSRRRQSTSRRSQRSMKAAVLAHRFCFSLGCVCWGGGGCLHKPRPLGPRLPLLFQISPRTLWEYGPPPCRTQDAEGGGLPLLLREQCRPILHNVATPH